MYDESTRNLPHTHRPHRRGVDQAAHPDGELTEYARNSVPAARVARTCPTCGYSASYASAALANFHHPRHSCAEAQRLASAARRRTGGGPIRDCQHCGEPHRHGTRTAYVKDQCRCTQCRAANSAASKTAHRQRVLGRWAPFVDAAPVRAHIETCARPASASTRSPGSPASHPATSANLSRTHEVAEPDPAGPPGDRAAVAVDRRD